MAGPGWPPSCATWLAGCQLEQQGRLSRVSYARGRSRVSESSKKANPRWQMPSKPLSGSQLRKNSQWCPSQAHRLVSNKVPLSPVLLLLVVVSSASPLWVCLYWEEELWGFFLNIFIGYNTCFTVLCSFLLGDVFFINKGRKKIFNVAPWEWTSRTSNYREWNWLY